MNVIDRDGEMPLINELTLTALIAHTVPQVTQRPGIHVATC